MLNITVRPAIFYYFCLYPSFKMTLGIAIYLILLGKEKEDRILPELARPTPSQPPSPEQETHRFGKRSRDSRKRQSPQTKLLPRSSSSAIPGSDNFDKRNFFRFLLEDGQFHVGPLSWTQIQKLERKIRQ